MGLVFISLMVLGLIGLLFGIGLAIAGEKLKVETDPRIEKILNVLPGANCGACGYPGCEGFAKAVVEGIAPYTGCVAGGEKVAKGIAEVLGLNENITITKKCGFSYLPRWERNSSG